MTIREIDEMIKLGDSLKLVAQAYGEIASLKIRKIRREVENQRLFFKEIAHIFRIVKFYAQQKGLITTKTKQTISILLTSNQGFYGGIDALVTRYFIDSTAKFPTDRVVVGKIGREYLREVGFRLPFHSVEFKKDLPTPEELTSLIQIIGNYKQVLVFYPQLSTAFVQKEAVTDITQSFVTQTEKLLGFPTRKWNESDYFIFEPELIKIVRFFDMQIMSLLLNQTFFEAEVSRTASRLLAMDQAQREADNSIDEWGKLRSRLQKDKNNTRLLETFSSLSALRKEEINL